MLIISNTKRFKEYFYENCYFRAGAFNRGGRGGHGYPISLSNAYQKAPAHIWVMESACVMAEKALRINRCCCS